jgi:hypothetical protein
MDREYRQEQASGYWKAASITGFTPDWKLSEDECRTRRESSQAKDMTWWKEIRSRVAGDEIIEAPEDMTIEVLFLEPREIQTLFQRKLRYVVPMRLSYRQNVSCKTGVQKTVF